MRRATVVAAVRVGVVLVVVRGRAVAVGVVVAVRVRGAVGVRAVVVGVRGGDVGRAVGALGGDGGRGLVGRGGRVRILVVVAWCPSPPRYSPVKVM